jgi:nitrate reductase NapE component
MNINEGPVTDPFELGKYWETPLSLWRDRASRNWIWLDMSLDPEVHVVYWQIWRPEWKKYLVLKVLPELSVPTVSAYDFRTWKCYL